MGCFLVVERDERTVEQIRDVAAAEGWEIAAIQDPTDAIATAAELRPSLVLADASLAGAIDLLHSFSRSRGGCGSMALMPLMADVADVNAAADRVLGKPFTREQLVSAINALMGEATTRRPSVLETQQLTSAEIFGDLLDDLGGGGQTDEVAAPAAPAEQPTPPPPATPAPARSAPAPPRRPRDADIDRRLEQTLSGVLNLGATSRPTPKPTPAPPAAPPTAAPAPPVPPPSAAPASKAAPPKAPRKPSQDSAREIDDLLNKTLSGLDLGMPRRSRPPRQPAPPSDPIAAPPAIPPASTPPTPTSPTEPTVPSSGDEPGLETLHFGQRFEVQQGFERLLDESADVPLEPLRESLPAPPTPDLPPDPTPSSPHPLQPAAALAEGHPPPAPSDSPESAPGPRPSGPEILDFNTFEDLPKVDLEADTDFGANVDFGYSASFGDDIEPSVDGSSGSSGSADPPIPLEAQGADSQELSSNPFDFAIPEIELPATQPEPSSLAAPAPESPSPVQLTDTGSLATPEPGRRFGHYTLLERIAAGGMAEVWKARMDGVAGFQKTVAIKKILPHLTENKEFETMFVDEAKLAAELSHPNIIHIYDLGEIHAEYYIAMEYVEGKDLRSIFNMAYRKALPLPQPLALLIASRLASALDYAHRKRDAEGRELGLVHRDVSPQNVLVGHEGDVKLCDFGIVKAVSKASQTEMGALKGKLQYMAPEQAWGREVDSRADIFALGSLTFEMLTGERLFAGESELSVLELVRTAQVRSPREVDPSIPVDVESLVMRALSEAPESRYQRAGQMRDEIETCLERMTLRPSSTELAQYLRQLLQAEDADDETLAAHAAQRSAASRAAAERVGSRPGLEVDFLEDAFDPQDADVEILSTEPLESGALNTELLNTELPSSVNEPALTASVSPEAPSPLDTIRGQSPPEFARLGAVDDNVAEDHAPLPPAAQQGSSATPPIAAGLAGDETLTDLATDGIDPGQATPAPTLSDPALGETVTAVSPLPSAPEPPAPRKRTWLWILLFALLLAAIVVAALFMNRQASSTGVPGPVTPVDGGTLEIEPQALPLDPAGAAGSGDIPDGAPQGGEAQSGPSAEEVARDLMEREGMTSEAVESQLRDQEEELRRDYEQRERQLRQQIEELTQASGEEPDPPSDGG